MTSNERLAKEEGHLETAREDVLEVLKVRFKDVPYQVKEKINYCDSIRKLKSLLRQAITVKSVDDLKV